MCLINIVLISTVIVSAGVNCHFNVEENLKTNDIYIKHRSMHEFGDQRLQECLYSSDVLRQQLYGLVRLPHFLNRIYLDNEEKILLCHIIFHRLSKYKSTTDYIINWAPLFDAYAFTDKQVVALFKRFPNQIQIGSMFVRVPTNSFVLLTLHQKGLLSASAINTWAQQMISVGNDMNVMPLVRLIDGMWNEESFCLTYHMVSYIIQFGLTSTERVSFVDFKHIDELLQLIASDKTFTADALCSKSLMEISATTNTDKKRLSFDEYCKLVHIYFV